MSSLPKSEAGYDRSKIAEVRQAWVEAVIEDDVGKLLSLVTEDVVVVHGNGQCTCGKDELKKDAVHELGVFDVNRTVVSSEVSVQDKWAVEFDEVETTRARVGDSTPIYTHFKDVFVFRRQLDGSWKVARILELFS